MELIIQENLGKPFLYSEEYSIELLQKANVSSKDIEVLDAALNKEKLNEAIGGPIYDDKMIELSGYIFVKDSVKSMEGNESIHIINALTLFKEVGKSIITSIWELGVSTNTLSEQERELIAVQVIKDIYRDFKSKLSVEEIKLAFRNGVRKIQKDKQTEEVNFNPHFGVSVSTFYKWIEIYLQETKLEAMRQLKTAREVLQLDKPKEDSIEKKLYYNKIWLNQIIESFDHYKETSQFTYNDFGHLFFKFYRKHKLVEISDEKMDQIIEEGKKLYKKEVELEANDTAEPSKHIAKAVKGYQDQDPVTKQKLIKVCRRLCIQHVFDTFIKEGRYFGKEVTDANLKDIEEMKKETSSD